MKQIYSLRFKILVIVFAFIFVFGLSFFLYSLITTANFKRLRLLNIEKTVEFETEKVNKIISEIESAAVFYALGGMFILQGQSQELAQKFVLDFLSGIPMSVGGGIWFEPYAYNSDHLRAGFYAYFDKTDGVIKLDDIFFSDEYDYHNKDWYREIADNAVNLNQVIWTRPYVDDSGSFSLMTTAGSPFFDETGRLKAISTVDWEIEEVIRELNEIKPTENSFVLLCVPEKDYIISGTRTNSVIGASIDSIPWDITSDSFVLEGVSYLRFGRYMDNGWLLSIQIPENEIIAEVEKNNSSFSIFILFSSAIMLVLAYLLISKFVNKPVRQLTEQVSQLALGSLDSQITVSTRDELRDFADVLNKMKNDLKKSIEENIRERTENERVNAELDIAMRIQTSMLPSVSPVFNDGNEVEIFASMTAARKVGGDFYDYFFIDKNNLALVIADVSGKGVPAALFMVIAKTLIENFSYSKSPKRILETVNKKLLEENENGMFVTVFLGVYNLQTRELTYANAGHNPPLIKKQSGSFEFLKTEPCIVLAWNEQAKFNENQIAFESGDILFLYTDGIPEAMNLQRELFSDKRLVEILNNSKSNSPKDIIQTVKSEIDNFCGTAEQADDITMFALKINDAEELMTLEPVEMELYEDKSENELHLEAKTENLYSLMHFLDCGLKNCNISEVQKNEVKIAAEEIFMNIAKYAYKNKGGEAVISVSVHDKISVKFEDFGAPYNPLETPAPDLNNIISNREIGGLGIYLVRKIMDSVEYNRENDKNILIITKKRN